MVKTNNKNSIAVKLILIFTILSILLMILTPIIFLDYGVDYGKGIHPIWGWTGIFGGTVDISNGYRNLIFDFNWTIYITLLVLLIAGVTTYLIGPKSRGYYIFGAILFVLCAIMFFTITTTWILETMTNATTADKSVANLGVGPWAAGFLSIFSAIACIFEFKTVKLR